MSVLSAFQSATEELVGDLGGARSQTPLEMYTGPSWNDPALQWPKVRAACGCVQNPHPHVLVQMHPFTD